MRDIASNIKVSLALSPAVQAASVTGNVIHTQGFDSAALVVNTGAIASAGDFSVKIQESDTTTSGDFTDVAAGGLVGSVPASLTADGSFKLSYIGHKRYIRAVFTKNGGTSIAAGAVAVLGHARNRPIA